MNPHTFLNPGPNGPPTVLFYWNSGETVTNCYADDIGGELFTHPEWWLRDDNGTVFSSSAQCSSSHPCCHADTLMYLMDLHLRLNPFFLQLRYRAPIKPDLERSRVFMLLGAALQDPPTAERTSQGARGVAPGEPANSQRGVAPNPPAQGETPQPDVNCRHCSP